MHDFLFINKQLLISYDMGIYAIIQFNNQVAMIISPHDKLTGTFKHITERRRTILLNNQLDLLFIQQVVM